MISFKDERTDERTVNPGVWNVESMEDKNVRSCDERGSHASGTKGVVFFEENGIQEGVSIVVRT